MTLTPQGANDEFEEDSLEQEIHKRLGKLEKVTFIPEAGDETEASQELDRLLEAEQAFTERESAKICSRLCNSAANHCVVISIRYHARGSCEKTA